MSGLIARHVSACSMTFKPVNSFEGLGLHAEGYKAGSLGYTWDQAEARGCFCQLLVIRLLSSP